MLPEYLGLPQPCLLVTDYSRHPTMRQLCDRPVPGAIRLLRPSSYQPRFTHGQILTSYLCSFVGIAVLAYLTAYTGYPLIVAPFGATAVLVVCGAR